MPQSLACLRVHLVFSTKGCLPLLQDAALRRDLHAYLAATAQGLDCPALWAGGVADHVHAVGRRPAP